MSDNMKPELHPHDDELAEFTDRLLAGELDDGVNRDLSDDQELRDLEEMAVHITNTFGATQPDPAMVQRGKKKLSAEWQNMGLSPEKVPFWKRWSTALAASGRRGQQARAIALIVALIPLLLAVGVYTDAFQNLNLDQVLRGTAGGRDDAYPAEQAVVEVSSVSGNVMMLTEDASRASISDNGRYVVYESSGTIFVHDRVKQETYNIGIGNRPALSANGNYVAFQSNHSNGVSDSIEGTQIFVVSEPYDQPVPQLVNIDANLINRANVTISDKMDIAFSNDGTVYVTVLTNDSWATETVDSGDNPRLSDDGKWLVFEKDEAIFLYEVGSGNPAVQIAASGNHPTISQNGKYIAFESPDALISADDQNGKSDIYLYERSSSNLSLITANSNGSSWLANISSNGQYIVFSSDANNLTSDIVDKNGYQIYLHEWRTGSTSQVTQPTAGNTSSGGSLSPDVSSNALVVFDSTDNSLIIDDRSGMADVFMWGQPHMAMVPTNEGASGSQFELIAEFFPAYTDITITVNGHTLAALPSDKNGAIYATVTTGQADPGQYFITGHIDSDQDTVRLQLDPQAAIIITEENARVEAPVINIPAGIALDESIYLPLTIR